MANSKPNHIPPRKLNVGVVGIGRMGQSHALNILHKTPRANLICACSPADADIRWADEHLIPHGVQVYRSFEEMIETPGLEAVIIASTTSLHKEHTTKAMDRGIHVLCEKPVCTSIDELKELVTRVEANPKTKLMVGFTRRFDDSYQDAKSKVSKGAIGRPLFFRSAGCEKGDTSPFFKQYLQDSGGIFVDSVIHDIDLSLFILGEDSIPKSVSAAGVAAVHTELDKNGDADNAVGICEFWDGKVAFYFNSRLMKHGYDNQSEVFGTEGKISINLVPRLNRVEYADENGWRLDSTPSWYDRYKEAFVTEVNAWVEAVLDDKPMPVPLRSSLTGLVIAKALQESLRTGRKVEFEGRSLRQKIPAKL